MATGINKKLNRLVKKEIYLCIKQSNVNKLVIRANATITSSDLRNDVEMVEELSSNFNNDSESSEVFDILSYTSESVNSLFSDDSDVDSLYLDKDISSKELNLKDKLRYWASSFKVKQNAVSALLKVLQEYHPELPADCRTLLKTCRNTKIVQHQQGEFCYFGIQKSLQKLNIKILCPDLKINMRINIDGLPISKSSNVQFWPILGLMKTTIDINPIVIACYCGSFKPSSVDEFFKEFIKEVQFLMLNGLEHDGLMFQFNVLNFNCDAPARAFVKCIKGHNAYFGCEKCTQKGVAIDRHVKFLEIESKIRSDEDFSNKVQKGHHNGTSPLLELGLGLVSQFPLDSMHLVDLGVVRKLILYWMRYGPRTQQNSVRFHPSVSELTFSPSGSLLSQESPSHSSKSMSQLTFAPSRSLLCSQKNPPHSTPLTLNTEQRDDNLMIMMSRVLKAVTKTSLELKDLRNQQIELTRQTLDTNRLLMEFIGTSTGKEPVNQSVFKNLPDNVDIPVSSVTDLVDLNKRLAECESLQTSLIHYLLSCSTGKTPQAFLNNISKRLMDKDVAVQYSRVGRKGKLSFENLKALFNVVLAAAAMRYKECSRDDLADRFGRVLAGAGDWDGTRKRSVVSVDEVDNL